MVIGGLAWPEPSAAHVVECGEVRRMKFLLFLICAFKGEDFFLKFWYVVFLESFSSNYFVTEMVVHFGGYL